MVIAERILEVMVAGQPRPLPIRLMQPEREEDGVWTCRYSVGWPDRSEARMAYGGDAVQAILSAMQMIGAELYSSTYHRNGLLRFDGWQGGYGFPVTNNIRDLLVGDDARYL